MPMSAPSELLPVERCLQSVTVLRIRNKSQFLKPVGSLWAFLRIVDSTFHGLAILKSMNF